MDCKKKKFSLPRHSCSLQVANSDEGPKQSCPKPTGSGLSHDLDLHRCPVPQSAEQRDHVLQVDQSPSTEELKSNVSVVFGEIIGYYVPDMLLKLSYTSIYLNIY